MSDHFYLDTIKRLEPEIAMIDTGAGWASVAVSLKRIADAMEKKTKFFPFVVLGRASNGNEIPLASFMSNADARRCQPLLEQLYGNTFVREII